VLLFVEVILDFLEVRSPNAWLEWA